MTVEAHPVIVSSLGSVKMEDRKRPAMADVDDPLPPAKRQATVTNGAKSQSDDSPWKTEDIQVR